jgi:hypothetical protein
VCKRTAQGRFYKINENPSFCPSIFPILEFSIITKELARGSPPSPFPRLDDHMLNQIFKKFNEAAEIRVWCLICCYEEEGKELQQNETKRGKTYHLQYQVLIPFKIQ